MLLRCAVADPTPMEIALGLLAEVRREQSEIRAELAGVRAEIALLKGRAAAWGALAGGGITVAAALVLRGLGL